MGVPEWRSGAGSPSDGQDVPALLGHAGFRRAPRTPGQLVRFREEAASAAIVMTPIVVPSKRPTIRPARKVNKHASLSTPARRCIVRKHAVLRWLMCPLLRNAQVSGTDRLSGQRSRAR